MFIFRPVESMTDADRTPVEATERPSARRSERNPDHPAVTPAELSAWLQGRANGIVQRWLLEVRGRSDEVDGPLTELLEEFLTLMVAFLPVAMGPLRDHVRPLFQQAAELYGNLAAVRGLAAGEAVEEMQLLREILLRFLHGYPFRRGAVGALSRVGLRELLQLNRLLDEGVTYASVGHMDTLFFNLLHGSGITGEPGGEVLEEIRKQVRGLAEELEQAHPPGGRRDSSRVQE